MLKECHFCDVCGKPMSLGHSPHDLTVYGYTVPGGLELHRKVKTDYGSSSKAGFGRGKEFCSEQCLAGEINRMLIDAHVKLRVAPVLEVVA